MIACPSTDSPPAPTPAELALAQSLGIRVKTPPAIDWQPLPRQRMALESLADETLYGGAAGGGKSDLILAALRLNHVSAVVFRRTYPQLEDSVIPRSREIFGDPRCYNAGKHTWTFRDGCRIAFRHLEQGDSVYDHQSAQYDGVAFDELTQFLESQYVYMLSRLRSTRPGQRCRVIAGTNPGGEGNDWVIHRWRPWLDPSYAGIKAKPGELRWFARDGEGKDAEVPEGTANATSRTFIPARLADNPYLPEAYRAQLMALPEPWRSQLLEGDWQIGLTDDAWQVIPSAWIKAGQARWTPTPPEGSTLDAIGFDVALRGEDYAVKAKRFGAWIAPLERRQGRLIQSSADLLAMLEPDLRASTATVNIDGVGWGEGLVALCASKGLAHRGVIAGRKSEQHAKGNPKLRFANLKTEYIWRVREALDPSQGGALALPPDDDLARDLRSYRWEPHAGGAKVMSKDKQIEELGHSPDAGDAVALAVCGFEPPGELVILPDARPSCLLATKPIVWIAGDGKPTLMVEGLNEQWHREGDLLRACWYSPRGPSGAMWLHRDGQDGAIVEFKAIQIEGRLLPTQFARAVVMESRDAAGKWHDYASDLKGTPAELGHEEMQHSIYEELDAAFEKAYRDLRAEVRLPWNVEREALDEFAGWAELMEWMAGAERKQKKGDVRMLLFSTEAAYRQVLDARYRPETKATGESEDRNLEAVGGGGPLVRCLRMLAVEWARE